MVSLAYRNMKRKADTRLAANDVRRFQRRLLRWYARHGRHDFIWRKNPTPYRVLVAEVMLQQTQVARVEPKYREFLRRYPNFRTLAKAKTGELLALWSGLGYNRRALLLRACARQVVECFSGRLPSNLQQLVALPGIGLYTAAAVNIFARNRDEVCIDTNVRRVLIHELGLPQAIGPRTLAGVARQVLPRGRSRVWHSALMDYGRMVATSRSTGIKPKGGSAIRFIGSVRYYRGRLLKALLSGPRTHTALARILDLPLARVKKIAAGMARDGLLEVRGQRLCLPR